MYVLFCAAVGPQWLPMMSGVVQVMFPFGSGIEEALLQARRDRSICRVPVSCTA